MFDASPDAVPEPLAEEVRALVDAAGIRENRDLVGHMISTALGLGTDAPGRLDLKIAASALGEMRNAFRLFAPYAEVPKATIFGSARTRQDDVLYAQTAQATAALSERGWMVVTGAGPGIMQAAVEGAGPGHSLGVSIRLPFEERPITAIEGETNLVAMKYFFTRKLMLVKESRGFICLPGGFGTLDEMFELLTLQQTGKAEPTPIVLLDAPGGSFWDGLRRFVDDYLVPSGVISTNDFERALVTDSVQTAVEEVTGFWRNYDSLRWVGDRLVLRLRSEPTDAELTSLNDSFGELASDGTIERTEPLRAERHDHDKLDLPRITLRLNQFRVGELHRLIRAINALVSAPTA